MVTARRQETVDIGTVHYNIDHSRIRTYPRVTNEVYTVNTHANPNVFGTWTACIPINTCTRAYIITGVKIETADASTTYLLQFACCDPPTDDRIVGEYRFAVGTGLAARLPVSPVKVRSTVIAANLGVWARLMGSQGGKTITLSLGVTSHKETSYDPSPTNSWPW